LHHDSPAVEKQVTLVNAEPLYKPWLKLIPTRLGRTYQPQPYWTRLKTSQMLYLLAYNDNLRSLRVLQQGLPERHL
jgi:hypothetical protein